VAHKKEENNLLTNSVSSASHSSENKLHYVYIILSLIIILGLGLRLWHLQYNLDNGTLDSMYYIDTAAKYSNGYWLTQTATYKGQFLTLLMSFSISLFNPTFIVTKFVPLFFGSLLPLVTYLLASRLFNRKIGLLSALVVAINPILIFYSGLIFREILYSFTWITFVYFALIGFKGKKKYSIIAGIFFAFSSMTLELGIFAGIGIIFFLIFDSVLRINSNINSGYKNLDVFFFSAFLSLVPFVLKNYLTYSTPFIAWEQHLSGLFQSLPLSSSTFMWLYFGLMGLSLPYTIWLKITRSRSPKFFKNSFASSLLRKINNHKKTIIILLFVVATLISFQQFFQGEGFIWRIIIGIIKLLQVLILPQTLGFLLIFAVIGMIFASRSSNEVVLLLFIFVFCAIGLTWGITGHYMFWEGLDTTDQLLSYYPRSYLDNAFRYVTSYIPLFSIFSCFGVVLISNTIENRLGMWHKKKKNKSLIKTLIVFIFTFLVLIQFVYANNVLYDKAQREANDLRSSYNPAIEWLSSQGSPLIYCFNPTFREYYGQNKTFLLTDESINEIAKRASEENTEYLVTDKFGPYSDAQLAFWFGGMNEDPSRVGLSRFELVKSYRAWPTTQIYRIHSVDIDQTALVVQHENWGQEWASFLSQYYLVQTIKDEIDLSSHFTEDYDLIVVTDIQRILTDNELDALRQKVASGVILIVNGLSPAFMKLKTYGYWIGGAEFVEAPKEAKLDIRFNENAQIVSSDIDIDNNYAFYSNANYSSPTGLTELDHEVIVYATRIEDEAAAIYAKPYLQGTIIFSGIRPYYVTSAKDYVSYNKFIETLIEKAADQQLFP
jgi:hypothetical protein